MLRKPSLANGCKGDEQMQEVSLVSPLLISFADIGDKLVKTVAALWCSFSLDVDCWRAWLILNTWSKVGVKKRSSSRRDCHILGQVPLETMGWKKWESNWNETKQRAQPFEWHQPDILEVEDSQDRPALEQVRLARTDSQRQLAPGKQQAGALTFWIPENRCNPAQNLHINTFEAAALPAEWSPATQVAMYPLASRSFYGPTGGTNWKSECLRFGSRTEHAHDKKPERSHALLTLTGLTGLPCGKVALWQPWFGLNAASAPTRSCLAR